MVSDVLFVVRTKKWRGVPSLALNTLKIGLMKCHVP